MAKTLDCLLNKALQRKEFCGYSLKQITEIYLANYSEVSNSITVSEDGYEAISISGNWYVVEPAKDSASYNDDLVVGGNGSKYRTHQLSFSFNGEYSKDMAMAIDDLSLGKFVAILKLSDGSMVILGRLSGLEATAASSLSEASADGQNGLNVTLEGNTVESALAVASALKATVGENGTVTFSSAGA